MTVWERIGWTDPVKREAALERLARRLGGFTLPGVSPCELRSLVEVSNGLTAQEVAEKYLLSVTTVRTQLKNVKTKLGAKNINHAVYIALKKGLIR